MKGVLAAMVLASLAVACSDDGSTQAPKEIPPIDPTCTTLRVTYYDASSGRGWCEFSRYLPVLPEFVRNGMTAAIAEPWNGGSYDGTPGEACGECWELTSSWGSEVVMITDLCPIEGNPVCAGSFFHFDLAQDTAEALGTKGLDAVSARRVPCPVTGSIYAVVNDWNQWGYMRVSFVNHLIPIRRAWVRAWPDGEWREFERSGGAWQIHDAPRPDDATAVQFRFESAQGQTVDGTRAVPFSIGVDHDSPAVEDTGAQFEDQLHEDAACDYTVPPDIYTDSWGGIDRLYWKPNPWGDVKVSETSDGCQEGESCLKVSNFEDWDGFHLFYYPGFPRDEFTSLHFWIRTRSREVTVRVNPSNGEDTCQTMEIQAGPEWQEVVYDITGDCTALDVLDSVSFYAPKDGDTIYLDSIELKK